MQRELSWLREDILSDDQRRRATAVELGVPFVTLTDADIAPEALMLLPEPLCRAHTLVAFATAGAEVEVALLDMADLAALDSLRPQLKRQILPRLTDRASLTRALIKYQGVLKERFGERIQHAVTHGEPHTLVDALLGHALSQGARQAHIEEREQGLLVRYRHGAVLRDAMTMPAHAAAGLFARLRELAHLPEGAHEGRFVAGVGEERTAVRVAALPGPLGKQKVTLHFTRERAGQRGFTLESLGLHGAALEDLYRAVGDGRGLVVVCGPEGSGKSTLLYTLLDSLAVPEKSIATIEERIEYRLPFAMQMQTAPEVGLTMAAGLRALLRADPEIVMVGAVRDAETALLALQAANRGVLVLCALEAPTAAEGIAQFLDFGADPLMLASALQAAVATRVLRKLCSNTPQYRPTHAELSAFEGSANFAAVLAALKEGQVVDKTLSWKDVPLYRAAPCGQCQGGYRGRVGIQEVLPASATIRALIERRGGAEEFAAAARQSGALNVVEDALFKVAHTEASLEEALALAGE